MGRETRTYSLIIEFFADEEGYLAYFPALPGCHTWAATYDSVLERAKEALVGYLEALADTGRVIPRELRRDPSISIGITVDVPIPL
jgi:predicted RNase H-like HicB family nuclease